MRLLGKFSPQEAQKLLLLLAQKNMETQIQVENSAISIWIVEEDLYTEAQQLLGELSLKTEDKEEAKEPFIEVLLQKKRAEPLYTAPIRNSSRFFTRLLIGICVFLYIIVWIERMDLQKNSSPGVISPVTQVERELLFEDPLFVVALAEFAIQYRIKSEQSLKEAPLEVQQQYEKIEQIPRWPGLMALFLQKAAPSYKIEMFQDLKKGEIWRLFTPALLHGGLLHLLFNIWWLGFLGKVVEPLLGWKKFAFLVLIIGVVANICQYIATGPYFMGISGVVIGLVGFIWQKQKKFPEQRFRMDPSTARFVFYFVIGMFLLEIFLLFLEKTEKLQLVFAVGNTAHILGGIVGILLAKTSYFSPSYIQEKRDD